MSNEEEEEKEHSLEPVNLWEDLMLVSLVFVCSDSKKI
jgi:hypothetical protein